MHMLFVICLFLSFMMCIWFVRIFQFSPNVCTLSFKRCDNQHHAALLLPMRCWQLPDCPYTDSHIKYLCTSNECDRLLLIVFLAAFILLQCLYCCCYCRGEYENCYCAMLQAHTYTHATYANLHLLLHVFMHVSVFAVLLFLSVDFIPLFYCQCSLFLLLLFQLLLFYSIVATCTWNFVKFVVFLSRLAFKASSFR